MLLNNRVVVDGSKVGGPEFHRTSSFDLIVLTLATANCPKFFPPPFAVAQMTERLLSEGCGYYCLFVSAGLYEPATPTTVLQ